MSIENEPKPELSMFRRELAAAQDLEHGDAGTSALIRDYTRRNGLPEGYDGQLHILDEE